MRGRRSAAATVLPPAALWAACAACAPSEHAELTNPFDPRNAALDADGDGVPNAEEVAAGGDPRRSDADGDGRPDGADPCPAEPGGACLSEGVCAAARAGCPCAAEYPETYEADVETRCDGLDNDCDGRTDEDDPGGGGDCDTELPGVCGPGVRRCRDGALVCVALAEPAPAEACDGLDDDCDGDTDEDDPDGGGPCNSGQAGACAPGVGHCIEGVVACVPDRAPAAAEACDGVDDDCDGETDEGDPGGGEPCDTGDPGVCAPGVRHCVAGAVRCVAGAAAGVEACNLLDDDCDGDTDEDDPGGGGVCDTLRPGVCAPGVRHCVGGQVACVGNVEAAPGEVCDGLDNDCDGDTDEDVPDLGLACATGRPGVCARGLSDCVEGALVCVPAATPADDLCDGLDNDCDGDTDDAEPAVGEPCGTGRPGVCATGERRCEGGALACAQSAPEGDEVCNGLDDNCDGQTDEDDPELGQECDTGLEGDCEVGTLVCEQANLACVGPEPAAEVCGGGDEDCDGVTDERCNGCPAGLAVPEGWACIPATPGAGFLMGSPPAEWGRYDDEPAHVVHITRPYFMQLTEVTRAEWTAVAGSAPLAETPCMAACPVCLDCHTDCLSECLGSVESCWESAACPVCVRPCLECRRSCPVIGVHWIDVMGYANRRSEQDGLIPCYALTGTRGTLGVDFWLDTFWWSTFACEGYRIPTEAEWEWAARGGTATATWVGNIAPDAPLNQGCADVAPVSGIAAYCANSVAARPVAAFPANPYGLHDMLGNVVEWTWDFYAKYPAGPVTDPMGGEEDVWWRKAARGGAYGYGWPAMRAAFRIGVPGNERHTDLGFRLVRTAPTP